MLKYDVICDGDRLLKLVSADSVPIIRYIPSFNRLFSVMLTQIRTIGETGAGK